MSRVRSRLVVRGRVQGVGFRWSCRQEAERVGVGGFVRNQPEGAVEVVVEGEAEAVAELVDWCRRGPRHAQVIDVHVTEEAPEGITAFVVTD